MEEKTFDEKKKELADLFFRTAKDRINNFYIDEAIRATNTWKELCQEDQQH